MRIDSEIPGESTKHDVPTAEMVMKICLLVSLGLGALIIVIALLGHRNIFDVTSSVLPLVAVQWFFYMMVKARRTSRGPSSEH